MTVRYRPRHYTRRDLILCAALTCREKAVLGAILMHQSFRRDGEARPCTASVGRLALLASVSPDSVHRALASLRDSGVLRVESLGHRRPNACTIVFARLEALRDPRLDEER
jgi:hypothetical protein